MKRRFMLLTGVALLASALVLAGCGKQEADTKPTPQSLAGNGDTSNMPPEAKKAMEEAKAKAQKGPQPKGAPANTGSK